MTDLVAFHGVGLHSGVRTGVRLERRPGPLGFVIAGRRAAVSELEVTRADQGVSVRPRRGGGEADLVEHLCGAFAGLSVRSGVLVTVTGPEIPLLDGGALELGRAILALSPPREQTRLVIRRAGTLEVEGAKYAFSPAPETRIDVEVEFAHMGRQSASFDGSARRFLDEIAPARTFGFLEDGPALWARGRAQRVDPAAVLVIEPDGGVLPPALPPAPDELARHKLLDLLGDLFLHGGPPIGRIFAARPGHEKTHLAMREALRQGLCGLE